MPYASVVDVMLILTRGDDVLLAQRQGTGYADGMWNLPSGKVEAGEHALDALIREAHEEIGVTLTADQLGFSGVVHCRNPEGHARLGLFFHATYDPARHGEPHNAEPDKCAGLVWHPITQPPPDTVPYTTAGLTLHHRGEPFTVLGWDGSAATWTPQAERQLVATPTVVATAT